MLSSRLLGLSSRSCSRVSSTSAYFPLYLQFRGYAKDKKKGPKLLEQLSEDNGLLRPWSWREYAIPTAILFIAGAAGMYVHINDERRAILKGTEQSTLSERSNTNRPAVGGPFKLIDTENRLVTDADLHGNWTIIYFGYTSCPDVGPREIQKMAKAIDILETRHNIKITPVFITIDPQRDTPAQLRAYLKEFHPKIIGLTGPVDATRQIAQEYRVYVKKLEEEGLDYLVQCSNNMYLLDPKMEVARFYGVEYDAVQLAEDIAKEVNKASH